MPPRPEPGAPKRSEQPWTECYEKVQKIAQGGFGTVFLVRLRPGSGPPPQCLAGAWDDAKLLLLVNSLLGRPFDEALQECSALQRHIQNQDNPRDIEQEFRSHWCLEAPDELRQGIRNLLALDLPNLLEDRNLVIKHIPLQKADYNVRKRTLREVQLHKAVARHPYVVSLFEAFVNKVHCALVLEECQGGTLAGLTSSFEGFYPEGTVMRWFAQLARAVAYIHFNRILHLDIKAENVLFHVDADNYYSHLRQLQDELGDPDASMRWEEYVEYLTVRLCDFGLAESTRDQREQVRNQGIWKGTPCYLAPETFSGVAGLIDFKTDVWASGVVLYFACGKAMPFGDVDRAAGERMTERNAEKQMRALRERINTAAFPPLPQCYSADVSELLGQLLAKQARLRPHFLDVLRTGYVAQFVDRGVPEPSP